MVHLRIVSPPDLTDRVREVLTSTPASILVAGTLVLASQRMLYDRRRRRHLREDGPPTTSARAER